MTILGTPTVTIASGTVSISGTVTVAGVVTVSGSVSISSGTVSISGTVTVAGSVSISSGTVSISGTVTVAGSVTITSGTVSISGTVNISGSVSITSGSVSITGTPNINIQSQSVTLNVNLPWTSRGSYVTVGNGAESFTTTAVDAGAQTLGFTMTPNGFSVTSLLIKGHQTGTIYLQQAVRAFTAGWYTIPINAASDTTYDFSWVTSTSAPGTMATYSSDISLGYPDIGQRTMAASMPVVIANDQSPAIWQAGQFITQIGATIAAGSDQLLVAGIVGQFIYVMECNIGYDATVAASAVALRDNSGPNTLHQFPTSILNPNSFHGWGQRTVVAGASLNLHNFAGVAVTCRGSIVYSQGLL